jgi:muramidase (phage lysozyme)
MATITAQQAGGANVARFLDLLAWSEGTSTSAATKNAGYDVIVSGVDGPEVFTDYSAHPFAARPPKMVLKPSPLHPNGLFSTAAGRYQVLLRYFEAYKAELSLPDFSPLSQDLIAVQQIRERRDGNHVSAIAHLSAGDIGQTIMLCAGIWASLPGNTYLQGGKTMLELLAKFKTL